MQNLKVSICLLLIFLFSLCFILPCFAEDTTYVWSSNSNSINNVNTIDTNTVDTNNNNIITNEITQTNSEIDQDNKLSLKSGSAILIEQTTRSNSIFS